MSNIRTFTVRNAAVGSSHAAKVKGDFVMIVGATAGQGATYNVVGTLGGKVVMNLEGVTDGMPMVNSGDFDEIKVTIVSATVATVDINIFAGDGRILSAGCCDSAGGGFSLATESENGNLFSAFADGMTLSATGQGNMVITPTARSIQILGWSFTIDSSLLLSGLNLNMGTVANGATAQLNSGFALPMLSSAGLGSESVTYGTGLNPDYGSAILTFGTILNKYMGKMGEIIPAFAPVTVAQNDSLLVTISEGSGAEQSTAYGDLSTFDIQLGVIYRAL